MTNYRYWIQLHGPIAICLLSWLPDVWKSQTQDEVMPLPPSCKFCVEKEEVSEDMQKWYSSCRLKQTLRKRRQALAWVVQSTEFTVCQGCPSLFLLARWSYRISAQDTKLLRKSESGFLPTCISDIQRNIVGTSPISRSIIKLLLFVTIHQPLTLPLPAQKATILWRKNYV